MVVVAVALAAAGATGARLGDNPPLRPTIRTVVGGLLALVLTYLIGGLFHVDGVTA